METVSVLKYKCTKTGHNLHKFAPQCTIFWGGTETQKKIGKNPFHKKFLPLRHV